VLTGRARAAACVSHQEMLVFVDGVHEQVEDTLSQLIAAAGRSISQGDIETESLEELRLAESQTLQEIRRCQLRAEEAQQDLATYRRELAELAEIARADTVVYNWDSISLLGAQSVSDASRSAGFPPSSAAGGEQKKPAVEGASLLQFARTNLESTLSTEVGRAAEMHSLMGKAARKAAACGVDK